MLVNNVILWCLGGITDARQVIHVKVCEFAQIINNNTLISYFLGMLPLFFHITTTTTSPDKS